MSQIRSERRYDVDWLRIIGMLGVFLFHCGMFFTPEKTWHWHVKNSPTSLAFSPYLMFIDDWIMPLFFVAAGIGSYYALPVRSNRAFLKERILRLLVPLLFGAFILSPHQVFIERSTHGQFAGSFRDFLPHAYEGNYLTGGNFAWMGLHLWFLLVLLLFSLLFLPVMRWLLTDKIQQRLDRMGQRAEHSVRLFLYVLPLILLEYVPSDGTGGFSNWMYLLSFLYGVALFPQPSFRAAIRKNGRLFLLLGIITIVIVMIWDALAGDVFPTLAQVALLETLRVMACWFLLIGLFWIGDRKLSFNTPFLQRVSPLVMVFYVLHQPVIVLIAYFIRGFAWALLLKYLFLVVVAFLCVLALMWVFTRVKVLRFLVGMK